MASNPFFSVWWSLSFIYTPSFPLVLIALSFSQLSISASVFTSLSNRFDSSQFVFTLLEASFILFSFLSPSLFSSACDFVIKDDTCSTFFFLFSSIFSSVCDFDIKDVTSSWFSFLSSSPFSSVCDTTSIQFSFLPPSPFSSVCDFDMKDVTSFNISLVFSFSMTLKTILSSELPVFNTKSIRPSSWLLVLESGPGSSLFALNSDIVGFSSFVTFSDASLSRFFSFTLFFSTGSSEASFSLNTFGSASNNAFSIFLS